MDHRDKAPHQLDLLPAPQLLPARANENLAKLRQALPSGLHLGTSSWSFPGWKGLVYGAKYTATQLSQRGLHPYARHPLLRTVGIDSAHYQPLPVETLRQLRRTNAARLSLSHEGPMRHARWCATRCTNAMAPGQVKTTRYFSTARTPPKTSLSRGCKARKSALASCFFNSPLKIWPPSAAPPASPSTLKDFLAALPQGPRYAVEVRNPELLTRAYGRALADHGAVHCFNAHPNMPTLSQQQRAMGNPPWPTWVVRWMLHDGLRYDEGVERYRPFGQIVDPDPQTRERIAALIRHAMRSNTPAFVIVNNKAEGSAPLSIVALAMAVAGLV